MTEFVVFADGSRGMILSGLAPSDPDAMVAILLDSGQRLFVPLDALAAQEEGGHRVAAHPSRYADEAERDQAETTVIPLVEETLNVTTRLVDTARVRLTKGITERQETVDEPLTRTEVDVRHVEIGQFVDAAPAVRHEGDVMIIPVLEEVLVVEKRLRLKEEIHVTQRQTQYRAPQTVTLRTETISEERIPLADASGQEDASGR